MREAGDRTTWTDPDAASRRPCTPPSTRRSTTTGSRGARRAAGRGRRRRAGVNALSAKLLVADAARRPRRLPGQRAVGPVPGRPRQPPPGRLRRRAAASPADGDRTRPSCAVTRARAAAAPRPPRAVHDVPAVRATGDAADHALAFDRGRRGHGRHPAADRAGRARRLGRHHPRCPPGAGATCSPTVLRRPARRRCSTPTRWRCSCEDR